MFGPRGAATLCMLVGACGFEHGALTPIPDAPPDVPPVVMPASCQAIKTAMPSATDGSYSIDPDGPGGDPPLDVTCDMRTDGGGWALVFVAPSTNLNGSASYSVQSPRMFADATKTLVAYRDAQLMAQPNYATLDLPADWRTQIPLVADQMDTMVSVSINGAAASPARLRYGIRIFLNFCGDAWDASQMFGRFCIENTKAPFFSGYATAIADGCSDSNAGWSDRGNCTSDQRFSIAIR